MIKNLFLITLFLLSWNLAAQEVNYLARSPKGLLMGDAYTAVVDDEFTFFYNPAALGRNKGVAFTLLDPSLGLTNALAEMDRFQNFPSGNGAAPQIANRVMDLPLYIQLGVFPTLKMGPFGFTLFANNKTSLMLRNATNPVLDIKYRYDRGFIFGYAYNVGSGAFSSRIKKSHKVNTSAGSRLSIGAAVKHMNRQGIQDQFDFFGTTILNKINSGATDLNSMKQAFGYSYGDAWGFDMGMEYAVSSGSKTLTSGLSILDVGDTHFKKTKGTGTVPEQKMMVNMGTAFKQDFGLLDYTLSADIHPVNSSIDFSRKFHLGAELAIPFVSGFAGWSEGYVSYGVSVRFWPLKLTTGFYGVEIGSKFHEQVANRFVLYLSLFDFSIDL